MPHDYDRPGLSTSDGRLPACQAPPRGCRLSHSGASPIPAYRRLEDKDGRYVLNGGMRQGKLGGRWKAESSKETGAFECSQPVLLPRASPGLVPLYAYAGPVYALEARSKGDRPVALVWRNPMSVLILDRRIAPVQR